MVIGIIRECKICDKTFETKSSTEYIAMNVVVILLGMIMKPENIKKQY